MTSDRRLVGMTNGARKRAARRAAVGKGLGEGRYGLRKFHEFALERHTWIADYPKWRQRFRVGERRRKACDITLTLVDNISDPLRRISAALEAHQRGHFEQSAQLVAERREPVRLQDIAGTGIIPLPLEPGDALELIEASEPAWGPAFSYATAKAHEGVE